MNFGLSVLVLTLLLQLTGCAGDRDFPSIGPASDPSIEERRILVTFTDSSIGRKVPGHILDRYRAPSGPVSATTAIRAHNRFRHIRLGCPPIRVVETTKNWDCGDRGRTAGRPVSVVF